jgi:hypothetical protein
VIIWLLCELVTRSIKRGNLLAVFVFVWFFSFGRVYDLIKGNRILGIEVGFFKLMAVYLILLVLLLVFFRKIKTPSPTVTLFFNTVFVFLLIFNAVQIAVSYNRSKAVTAVPARDDPALAAEETLPDVYYIILDAYSRQDALLENASYDNSEFIAALHERGFYVADCANSNYIDTLGSVASSLNYSYLSDLFPKDVDNDATIAGAIQNNAIRQDMAALGYQFVTAAGYSSFNDIRNSDLYLNVVDDPAIQDQIQTAQFSSLYMQTTMLRFFFELYTINPSRFYALPGWLQMDSSYLGVAKFWYYQTNYVFDELEKLPTKDGNYFVYAHINAPHGPFVFDAEGNYRYVSEPEDTTQYYNDAVTYINKRVLRLIDTLVNTSEVPPVIILQGDHGAHVLTADLEKHKILNAYYFPDRTDIPLYETITPVNTFRVLLKYYFNQDIDLISDRIYTMIDGKYKMIPSQCDYP